VTSAARKALIMVAAAALLCGGWLMFAPRAIGGPTTMVMTHGISMQPRFHTGDLAILHESSSYQVGDIVGYRSATLHTTVMHRIVNVNPDGSWVTKGDHNTWLDPDHPTRADVLGKLWLRVPHGGLFITKLVAPLLAFAIIAMLLMPGPRRQLVRLGRASWRRSRLKAPASWRVPAWRSKAAPPAKQPESPGPQPGRPSQSVAARATARPQTTSGRNVSGPPSQTGHAASFASLLDRLAPSAGAYLPQVLIGGLVVAALGLAVCMFGFAQPAHKSGMDKQKWTANTQFGWSAQVAASEVYPSGTVVSPQPLFTRIVDRVTFDSDVTSDKLPASVRESPLTLAETLSDGSGWSRTRTLATGSVRSDGSARLGATVSVRHLLDEMQNVQQISGSTSPIVVTLAVNSAASGTTPLGSLDFSLGSVSMAPLGKLLTATSGTTSTATSQASTVKVVGHALPVTLLRLLGLLLLLLGAGVAGCAAVARKQLGPETDSERLLRVFSGRVVRLGPGATDDVEYHDVADAKALCVLAKSETSMLFISGAPTTYFVDHNGQLFRYLPESSSTPSGLIPQPRSSTPDGTAAAVRSEPSWTAEPSSPGSLPHAAHDRPEEPPTSPEAELTGDLAPTRTMTAETPVSPVAVAQAVPTQGSASQPVPPAQAVVPQPGTSATTADQAHMPRLTPDGSSLAPGALAAALEAVTAALEAVALPEPSADTPTREPGIRGIAPESSAEDSTTAPERPGD
jgi:signal peptidase I